jgi:hypothetical protein
VVTAEQVMVLGAVPRTASTLGVASAECTLTKNRVGIDDEWLSDVDCSRSRLTWALREKAASVGGTALAALRCESDVVSERRVDIECEAEVARAAASRRQSDPNERATNPPGLAPELAERVIEPDASAAWRIRVRFDAVRASKPRRPLRADLVHEHHILPVDRVLLGPITARCERGCSRESVRAAVRIAAGRIGATDVARTRCSPCAQGFRCVGTAAVFERVPDFDPRLQ